MHPLINIALTAARDAAAALAHKTERLDRVSVLVNESESFTTSADLESDETLRYHIQKSYPDHSIHSRVSGIHQGQENEPVWLIDPLVGNLNFSKGYTRFAVSIAIQRAGSVEHAVVVSPMQSDEVFASKGKGAQLNSRRIRVSDGDLQAGLLGMDATGADIQQFNNLQSAFMAAGAHPRNGGHGALDVVDVACGRLQGGWCMRLYEHSLAAADLILQEAGGLAGTETGNPHLDSCKEQLFASPKAFKQLIKIRMQQDV